MRQSTEVSHLSFKFEKTEKRKETLEEKKIGERNRNNEFDCLFADVRFYD